VRIVNAPLWRADVPGDGYETMSTAATVPETHGELEGDDAFEMARGIGLRALLRDSFVRFRYADGFSHSRALAFGSR
jgi:hypothetical protein